MPIHQTLHRVSTKIKKFISNQQQRRVLGCQTQNPCNPLYTNTFEKLATVYKSKEKQKDFRHHPHHLLNLWSPFKLKTQSVSGMNLTLTHFLATPMLIDMTMMVPVSQIYLLIFCINVFQNSSCLVDGSSRNGLSRKKTTSFSSHSFRDFWDWFPRRFSWVFFKIQTQRWEVPGLQGERCAQGQS